MNRTGAPAYRAVIFDLDGVLVSTDRQHYRAWETIARERGIPFDEALNDRLRGVSRMESLEIILRNGGLVLDEREKEVLAEKKNALYRRLLNELDVSSAASSAGILRWLKAKGLKRAVASSSKNARFILHKTGLAPWFDVVVDGGDITRPKPDPEVFVKAALLLGTAPADALVVEDAAAGIEAAHAGGFDSAALGPARNSPLADYRIEALSGLAGVVFPSRR